MKHILSAALLAGVLVVFSGCRKPARTPDEQEIRRLIGKLTADDMVERNEATTAVVAAGAAAVPALRDALKDSDPFMRKAAASCLGLIRPATGEAVAALADALRDGEATVRRGAAEALGQIGPAAKGALGPLGEVQKDPAQPQEVREAADEAMKKIRQ